MSGSRRSAVARHRRVLWIAVVVVALLAPLAVAGGLSVRGSADAMMRHARAAQAALADFHDALKAGELEKASADLDTAERETDSARDALARSTLWRLRGVPLVGSWAQDARYLIDTSEQLVHLGRQLVELDNTLDGTDGFLLWPQEVDVDTLRSAARQATSIERTIAAARGALEHVHWVPLTSSVVNAKRTALEQLDALTSTMSAFDDSPAYLDALGATTPRQYLVVATDDTTSYASGGRPAATAILTLDNGSISAKPGQRLAPGLLADAISDAPFPIAARKALSVYEQRSGSTLDGVLKIDASGLTRLLREIPADTLPFEIEPASVADTMAAAAGPTAPPEVRSQAREVLLAVLRQVIDLQHGTRRLDALGSAAAGGDAVVFAKSPVVESVLAAHGLAGQVTPPVDDAVSVFVISASEKVGTTTTQRVELSGRHAAVDRTTRIDAPHALGLVEQLPASATGLTLTVDGRAQTARPTPGLPGSVALALPLSAGHHQVHLGYTLPLHSAADAHYEVAIETQPAGVDVVNLTVTGDDLPGELADGRWRPVPSGYSATIHGGAEHRLSLAASATAGDDGLVKWVVDSGGRLLLLLLVALGLAIGFRRQLVVPVAVALATYGLVPRSASSWFTGVHGPGEGVPVLHPGTWLVLVTAVVVLVVRPRDVLTVLRRHRIAFGLAGFLVVDALLTAALRHSGGSSQILEALVAAPALGLLVVLAVSGRPWLRGRLVGGFALFAVAIAVLAVVEVLLKKYVVYASAYDGTVWGQIFARHDFRAATTLDEPLNTGLVLAAALPIVLSRLRSALRVAMTVLLLAGIAATGSRIALAVGLVFVLGAALVRARDGLTARRVAAALAGVAALVLIAFSVGHGLLHRGVADGGSGMLRLDGVRAFLPHLPDHLLIGSGVGTSEHLTRAWMHSANSAENPLVMFAVDLGVVGALALVAALFAFSRIGRRRLTDMQWSFVVAFVVSLGFSSFASGSVAMTLLWVLAALAAAQADVPVVRPMPDAAPRTIDLTRAERRAAGAPAVTAVMAAKNAASTIGVAIESVREQTFADWELIVVDDGSDDDTAAAAVAAAAGDPRARVITLPAGLGRGAARNRALQEARGRLIAICDADDRSRPERFARQVEFLDTHRDIGVVGGQVANFGAWGGPTVVYHYPTSVEAVDERFARGHNPIPHQASMIRAELFSAAGEYADECVRAQDLELFLRMRVIAPMANLDEVVLDYRHHRRTTLRYWVDNGRWRRYAVARAGATLREQEVPTPERFHRRPTALAGVAYDVVAYSGNRVLHAVQGVRSL